MEIQVRRVNIYYANLPDIGGSVQAGRRPVIIVQTNWLNRTSDCVIIVALTSQIKNPNWNCHYIIPKIKGLPKQSMVIGEHHMTIAMNSLEEYRGSLNKDVMKNVTRAVKAVMVEDKRRNISVDKVLKG